MTSGWMRWALGAGTALVCAAAAAQVSLRDDLGRMVLVKKKPERIVTLAPFLTDPSQYGM